MSEQTVSELLAEVRDLLRQVRDPGMFGGRDDIARHQHLADAVDRLVTVCEALAARGDVS